MFRPALVCILVVACGTDPDTRPETADYVIEAILVPYCGRAACHSTNTAAHGLIFDTIDGSLASMTMADRGQKLVVPNNPDGSRLYNVLVDSRRVMPPDIPMPTKDIDLIRAWIANGAEGL